MFHCFTVLSHYRSNRKIHQSEKHVSVCGFSVPDDWCAPLGCEVVTKQDEGVCPSVRLRSLYIPLLQIPVKQEVCNRRMDELALRYSIIN